MGDQEGQTLELTAPPSARQPSPSQRATPRFAAATDINAAAHGSSEMDPEAQEPGRSADQDAGDAIGLLDGNPVRRQLLRVPPLPTWFWPAMTAVCLLALLMLSAGAIRIAGSARSASIAAAALSSAPIGNRLNKVSDPLSDVIPWRRRRDSVLCNLHEF